MNRNEHASTSGIRNKAECEAVACQKLKEHCHDAFKQYITYFHGFHVDKLAEIIEELSHTGLPYEKASWSFSEGCEFPNYCEQKYYAVVGKNFDTLSWWKEFKKMFPYVFPSMIIWILKPAMNTFQEGVFSMASWFNPDCLMYHQIA